MQIRPPQFIKDLMPMLVWNFPHEPNSVFITFDDGPTPQITPWVVDKLNEYNAKATFFCLGKNVEQHPAEFQYILQNGHTVGNHSYSHQRGLTMSVGSYVQDVDLADSFIHSHLYRPPYGIILPAQARMLGERYKIIMWDVISFDYKKNANYKTTCFNNVKNNIKAGSIVCFHDSMKSAKNMKYTLPKTLDLIVEKGWTAKGIE
ncbi:polysaccharide deacetylase [Bacteroidia bacterium]|nr:polysaccharide deacetylase [Bacteroidia bacterium]